ncbi:MAG: 2-oxo acid dehydrogenase subunit E2 [Alphaproteobacteria bacterium]|nr:2-oxo acid dehydrogenase subunit E2 [Alphaproteobacteria bacterium]
MGVHVIKLPDVGEGVAEAELVEWLVNDGENVREDQLLASVMTDKATVEIPSPVEGKIIWRGANIGDVISVGSPIIRIEIDGEGNDSGEPAATAPASKPDAPAKQGDRLNGDGPKDDVEARADRAAPARQAPPARQAHAARAPMVTAASNRRPGEAPLAPPAVRKRAIDAGVDLRRVPGSGPAGRITHDDLDAYIDSGGALARSSARVARSDVTETPMVGLRRKIAEKMSVSKSRIPHITYVEEIDVTALEDLRLRMNADRAPDRQKLTLLPFLMRAMARAIEKQPQVNALFDDDEGVIRQFGAMNMGVATQTESGLVVPVVRNVEALNVWDCAAELTRLADAARAGRCKREELTGSTITITSLGAMGGVVTTPVINHPEVAIVGVNKMRILPHWDGAQFVPRKMMNLSSSFDHRVIDGWDAAVFIQKIKSLLEAPAMIFVEE